MKGNVSFSVCLPCFDHQVFKSEALTWALISQVVNYLLGLLREEKGEGGRNDILFGLGLYLSQCQMSLDGFIACHSSTPEQADSCLQSALICVRDPHILRKAKDNWSDVPWPVR